MTLQATGSALPEGGPYFDDLAVGMVVRSAPAITLTEGHAAVHQAIVGDRLRLSLDAELGRAVTGRAQPPAHPALVWDAAIGQSTLITRRVVANLFYRGLAFRRLPAIGDTLRTTTEVVALRQNRSKPGRDATGMAVLRVRTEDGAGRPVLDFWRCAMLPLSDPAGTTGHDDDFAAIPADLDPGAIAGAVADWDLAPLRAVVGDDPRPEPGRRWTVQGGDVVSSAPELARLTLNVATAHHDETATGRRLVYGGHTIGVAASQLARTLPSLATIVAWHGCDHLAPVYEGDTLVGEIEVERADGLAGDARLLHLRCRTAAVRDGERIPVLDWRPVGVVA